MIFRGTISDGFRPTIEIQLGLSKDSTEQVEFILDTGFSGELALSVEDFARLQIEDEFIGLCQCETADGLKSFRWCVLLMPWDGGVPRAVEVIECKMNLLGMKLLEGFQLEMEIARGGKFQLTEKAT